MQAVLVTTIIEDAYTKLTEALVITTNKLIPTKDVKKSEFNPLIKMALTSYYANFYPEHDYEFYVMDKNGEDNYYYFSEKVQYQEKASHMILTLLIG